MLSTRRALSRIRDASGGSGPPPRMPEGGAAHKRPPYPDPAPARFPSPTAEHLLNVPNTLTLLRIGMCPAIGWAVATSQHHTALALLGIAGATDLLDGWVARNFKQRTMFGSIADPAADKLLMATMVVSLSLNGAMPLPLAAVILGRDVFLVLLAFYMRYQSLPTPRTLARYWDPRLPSVHVSPTRLSKWNTFLQLLLVGVLTLYPVLPEDVREHTYTRRCMQVLMWTVGATTAWTGIQYAVSRRAVRYLHAGR
ncbi:cardiolipin synthase (CMP-forming) [Malassezia sp. CBS 17886]|nr:cardiolipin synthase (CMP-forming) [Malassezia sp. CBS 17886]